MDFIIEEVLKHKASFLFNSYGNECTFHDYYLSLVLDKKKTLQIYALQKGSVPTVQNVSLNIKLLSYHNEQNKVVDVNNVPRCCDKNEGNRQKCKIWCKPTIEITV